jgi:hypothetical protein
MTSHARPGHPGHPMAAAILVLATLALRDVRLLGLGMVGWQVVVGLTLLIWARSSWGPSRMRFVLAQWRAGRFFGEDRLGSIVLLWMLFGIYAAAWTGLALQTGQVWPGATLDLTFACGLLMYASALDPEARRRWLLTVIGGYFASNLCAGVLELALDEESLEWLHKTEYNADGRLRMLAAEPSHLYAPFLIGSGLLWHLMKAPRAPAMAMIVVGLILSGSKAFPPVVVLALTIAWLKAPHARPEVQRRVRVGLVSGLGLGIAFLTGPGLRLLDSESPIAQLLEAGTGIVEYLEELPRDEQGSFATRAALFIHSATVILSHPFVGIGPAGEAPAILELALETGLITPEMVIYSQESPEFLTSKTLGLTLTAYYGLPFLLTAFLSVKTAIRETRHVALIFAPLVIVIAAFSTEGYNAWAWLALCLLTSDSAAPEATATSAAVSPIKTESCAE